jgi:LacI family transcriptional regulator
MEKSKRLTIRTVADHVNLSPTTVSLALRGDESIPEETRNRVIEAARELNYEYVSRIRKPLTRERLKRIVYLVNDYGDQLANPFYGRIMEGVEQACQEANAGLSFVVLPHDHPPGADLPLVLTNEVDGIVMASPYPRPVIDRVAVECACPVVLVDNSFPGSPYDMVMADDYSGGYQIAHHLIELGHTHIQMIVGITLNPSVPPSFNERYRGYATACQEAGLDALPPAVIPPAIDTQTPGPAREALFQSWLPTVLSADPRISAIFAASDNYALLTMQALQNMGYAIPQQMSVTGYDDFEVAAMVNPPLTTIHSYKRKMGQIALQRVMARLAGEDMPPLLINVGVDLVRRASTAEPPPR